MHVSEFCLQIMKCDMMWCYCSADSSTGYYWFHAYSWQRCYRLTGLHAWRTQTSRKKV